jgi:hypothetical protein
MLGGMARTTRITVTLPTEQVAEIRKVTANVSGYVADAVARQIRHQLLGEELRRYRRKYGAFTPEERVAARSRIRRGAAGRASGAA